MPDLMLPAFALTLVVNAVLVIVAIRALRSGQGLPRTSSSDRSSLTAVPSSTVATETTTPEGADVAPEPIAAPVIELPSGSPVKRAKAPGTKPARRPKSDGKRSTGPGSRRRFALPPMDEDHERVNRTIETFLTTPEESAASEEASALEEAAALEPASNLDGDPAVTGPTTVAVVAIEGLAELDPHDHPTADALAASVERALRGAARSTDRVAEVAGHVFRVTLPGTGELAARAYLRRVRSSVDPSLESAALPIRLATATAAALDGDVDAAFSSAIRHVGATAAARRATADAMGSGVQPPGRVSGG